jgi:hypothetical protein
MRTRFMIEITASTFLQSRDERLHPPSLMLLRWKLICHLSYGCVVHASGFGVELSEMRQVNTGLPRPTYRLICRWRSYCTDDST